MQRALGIEYKSAGIGQDKDADGVIIDRRLSHGLNTMRMSNAHSSAGHVSPEDFEVNVPDAMRRSDIQMDVSPTMHQAQL